MEGKGTDRSPGPRLLEWASLGPLGGEGTGGPPDLSSLVFPEADFRPGGTGSTVRPQGAHAGLQHGHHLHHGCGHRCPRGLLGREPGREEVSGPRVCVRPGWAAVMLGK